jgi:hypothetical protein
LLDFKIQLEQLRKGCCHPQILDKSLRPSMYSSTGDHYMIVSISKPAIQVMTN